MSAAATARATACPSWCSEHVGSGEEPDAIHGHRVQVGNVAVTVEWWEGIEDGAPIISVDDHEWVNGQDARDLAAAILAASDVIDTGATAAP